MTSVDHLTQGILSLPNEILLSIFDLLPCKALVRLTPTCHQFHTLILRIIQYRLQVASGLDGHALYFKCHHPSQDLRAPKMYCEALGTDGLEDILTAIYDETSYLGQVKSLFGLYTRFKPQKEDPNIRASSNRAAMSRIYNFIQNPPVGGSTEPIVETVTVDSHDLFTQLSTSILLGKREPERRILVSLHGVSDGVIRVWRDWLLEHCESRSWSDGEPIAVYHDAPGSSSAENTTRVDSVVDSPKPTADPCVLWLGDRNFGVKLRVKEKKWLRANSGLDSSDIEVPVSYLVEFDGSAAQYDLWKNVTNNCVEVLVRTSHLLLKVEEAQRCMDSGSGKAIVFGSFRG